MSYAEEDYNHLDRELSRATDRITALFAAGERLAGFADHRLDCNDNYRPRKPCDCGLTEAMQAWKELTND